MLCLCLSPKKEKRKNPIHYALLVALSLQSYSEYANSFSCSERKASSSVFFAPSSKQSAHHRTTSVGVGPKSPPYHCKGSFQMKKKAAWWEERTMNIFDIVTLCSARLTSTFKRSKGKPNFQEERKKIFHSPKTQEDGWVHIRLFQGFSCGISVLVRYKMQYLVRNEALCSSLEAGVDVFGREDSNGRTRFCPAHKGKMNARVQPFKNESLQSTKRRHQSCTRKSKRGFPHQSRIAFSKKWQLCCWVILIATQNSFQNETRMIREADADERNEKKPCSISSRVKVSPPTLYAIVDQNFSTWRTEGMPCFVWLFCSKKKEKSKTSGPFKLARAWMVNAL